MDKKFATDNIVFLILFVSVLSMIIGYYTGVISQRQTDYYIYHGYNP